MFRLTTLGSPALADTAGAEIRSVLAQPKRLAVLAYVATEGSQGFVRRETLLALFWPESDAEAARQALRQTLYHLRRETGEDVFHARSGDEIAINSDVLWCDAVEFDQCARARRYLEAMALYRGDFLPAFAFANQSAEFEQWLESTRTGYRNKAAAVAAVLRDDTERAGDRDAASAWARGAAQLSPDDERTTRRLIEVLDAGGDRAGALRAYDEFARRLWSVYETRPSAATAALVAGLRTGTPTAVTTSAGVAPQREGRGAGVIVGVGPADTALAPAPAPTPDRGGAVGTSDHDTGGGRIAGSVSRRGRPTQAIAGGLVVAVLLAGVWLLGHRTRLANAGGTASPTLAVLPFEHDGPATDGYLAGGIAEDIRSRLAALPGLGVIAGASAVHAFLTPAATPLPCS